MKERKILVPLDGSAISAQTVQNLISRKEFIRFPLTLLHVFDPRRISYEGVASNRYKELEESAREASRSFIAEQQALFTAAGIAVTALLKEGFARETICELADSGEFDLLVIGRKPESELQSMLFGQVANYVIHNVQCPVMIM